jgi:hydroxymethylpyrimidine pyrophosphatase-like HAD family hydrolase
MCKKILFFCDLDDTIIQTGRKTDFTKSPIVAAYNKKGNASSYIYPGVKMFLEGIISSGVLFIPTTARNIESYQRTRIISGHSPKYVVLNFGGTILVDGKVDAFWDKEMRSKYEKIKSLSEIINEVSKNLDSDKYNLSVNSIDGFYVNIHNKRFTDSEPLLVEMKRKLELYIEDNKDFYLHINGNSFAILPSFLNKKNGVEYLISKINPSLVLGAGDNPSDLGFMRLADFSLVPKDSIIYKQSNK